MNAFGIKRLFIAASLAATLFFVPTTWADVTLTFNGDCSQLDGAWNGQGTVDAWLLSCEYVGSGSIKGTDSFTIDLNFTQSGGSGLCPNERHEVLSGTCANGNLTITSKDVSLEGSMSDNNHADMTGTVKIVGITADLDVSLAR